MKTLFHARRKSSLISRFLLAAAALTLAQLAHAHAHPQHMTPAAGATVDSSATTQVSILFDDGLEGALSTLSVSNAAGQTVTSAKATMPANDRKTLSVAVPRLAPGVYTVHWVAVAQDTHRTHGDYTFTVK